MPASSTLNSFVTNTKNLLFIGGLVITICSGMFTAASVIGVKFIWPILIEQLRTELNVATKDDVATINERIDEITGDDRILKVLTDQSFVHEPVIEGEQVRVTMAMVRTQRGLGCVAKNVTPLFTDDRNIPFPGQSFRADQQVTLEPVRMVLDLTPPSDLRTGRVLVHLSIEYTCPFGFNKTMVDRFERTPSLSFQLDPV